MLMRRKISTRERVAIFQRWNGEIMDRFMDKCIPEPNSGCWLWLGASKANGYGHMWDGERYEIAHRLSYRLHCGPIPEGAVVCHSCDTRCCVNPSHLWVGTQQENLRDCVRKGRLNPGRFPGEAHRDAKLTEEAVQEIRADLGKYGFRKRLAQKFGVAEGTISNVRARFSWRHVP